MAWFQRSDLPTAHGIVVLAVVEMRSCNLFFRHLPPTKLGTRQTAVVATSPAGEEHHTVELITAGGIGLEARTAANDLVLMSCSSPHLWIAVCNSTVNALREPMGSTHALAVRVSH